MNEIEKTEEFMNDYGLQFTARFKGYNLPAWADADKKMPTWECTFTRQDANPGEQKTFTVTFYNSIASKGAMPTAYDVLACLTKGYVGTFEDFCLMFGYDMYDENTGKINQTVKRVYNGCVKEYKKVQAFFTRPGELERLCDIY